LGVPVKRSVLSPSSPLASSSVHRQALATWDLPASSSGEVSGVLSEVISRLSALVRTKNDCFASGKGRRVQFENLADGWIGIRIHVSEWAPDLKMFCHAEARNHADHGEVRVALTIYSDSLLYRRVKMLGIAAMAGLLILPFLTHLAGVFAIHAIVAPLLALAIAGQLANFWVSRTHDVESLVLAAISTHLTPRALSLSAAVDPFRRSNQVSLAPVRAA
jgi:hypothetical protein